MYCFCKHLENEEALPNGMYYFNHKDSICQIPLIKDSKIKDLRLFSDMFSNPLLQPR